MTPLGLGLGLGFNRGGGGSAGIILSAIALPSFYVPVAGTPSDAQAYIVECRGLLTNVTVTAPTGFQVSQALGSGYAGSITLDKEFSGNVYVRMTGAADGQYNGHVTHASTGVDTVSVFVSGSVGSVLKMYTSEDWKIYDSTNIKIYQ